MKDIFPMELVVHRYSDSESTASFFKLVPLERTPPARRPGHHSCGSSLAELKKSNDIYFFLETLWQRVASPLVSVPACFVASRRLDPAASFPVGSVPCMDLVSFAWYSGLSCVMFCVASRF